MKESNKIRFQEQSTESQICNYEIIKPQPNPQKGYDSSNYQQKISENESFASGSRHVLEHSLDYIQIE